jgi:AcrR family transcriptional regulator
LLDGLMHIAAAEGFADLKMADLARRLHCSVATLYKLAPAKVDLVSLALERWGKDTLSEAESRSLERSSASERARTYYRAGAERTGALSHEFRRDVERFSATRQTWRAISDGFIERFSQLLAEAAQAGEIRTVNATFLVGLFRYIAYAVRDEELLGRAG